MLWGASSIEFENGAPSSLRYLAAQPCRLVEHTPAAHAFIARRLRVANVHGLRQRRSGGRVELKAKGLGACLRHGRRAAAPEHLPRVAGAAGGGGVGVTARRRVTRLLQLLVLPIELRAERLEVVAVARPHVVGELVQQDGDEAGVRPKALAVVRAHAQIDLLARVLVETHHALRVHTDLAVRRHLRQAAHLEAVPLHDAEDARVLGELLEPLPHRADARHHARREHGKGLEPVELVRGAPTARLVRSHARP
mmetsp:Transcript_20273/g.34524  ORF Transcript_20273/g.34524 Transcript_20273/m.34524 type:complete len:252 (+) Transcript_20273:122-877(+)